MEPDDLNSFKAILERLLSFPLSGQIKIDFDLKERVFRLSLPIYSSKNLVPPQLKEYVEAREGKVFKPHATTFVLEGQTQVFLNQEIPFQLGFQPAGLRDQIHHFCQMSKKCHKMLMEIAVEEAYKEALHLDIDFPE